MPSASPSPAGYSGTPLPQKLGMRAGQRIVIIDAPPGLAEALGPLPDGVSWKGEHDAAATGIDLILYFTTRAAELDERFAALAHSLHDAGMLWIGWPKQASRLPTDLTEDVVRRIALAHGMVDVKVCAIDAVWSGLKLVYRLADRGAR